MRDLALLLALLAPAATAARDHVPPATPAGDPVDCLSIPQIRQTLVRSDRVIDFVGPGRRVWRNTLPNACPGLGVEQRFAYTTSLSQLCSVDLITVPHASGPPRGAACGLGRFQPVGLPRAGR